MVSIVNDTCGHLPVQSILHVFDQDTCTHMQLRYQSPVPVTDGIGFLEVPLELCQTREHRISFPLESGSRIGSSTRNNKHTT